MSDTPAWADFTDKLSAALDVAAADRSAADRAEALLKVTFSEMVNAVGGAVAKAEHEARGSAAYRKLVEDACELRTRSNLSAARVRGMEHKLDCWRTANATRRAEMNLK